MNDGSSATQKKEETRNELPNKNKVKSQMNTQKTKRYRHNNRGRGAQGMIKQLKRENVPAGIGMRGTERKERRKDARSTRTAFPISVSIQSMVY